MVVIHEFGHFIVAKLFGIRVETFSVGFGKRIWGFKRGDTDYRLSLIPLGGYVKMAGENLDEKITGAPDEFMSKPKWQRFCVAVAGPAMNILTALMIPAAIAMVHHEVPAYVNRPALIKAVEPESPAEAAGLKPGDLILSVEGVENPTWRDVQDKVLVNFDHDLPLTIKRGEEIKQVTVRTGSRGSGQDQIGYAGFKPEDTKIVVRDLTPDSAGAAAGLQQGDNIVAVNGNRVEQSRYGIEKVVGIIRDSNGQPVTLTVVRDDQQLDITAAPQNVEGVYRLGFTSATTPFEMVNERLGPMDALKYSVETNLRVIQLTGTALGQVFTGKRAAGDTLSGPIGIAGIVGEASKHGVVEVLGLMGFLSLNLGLLNLLPIPVLDGGLIFMLGLEALLGLFGLSLTLKIKERMMQVGFVMLMLLMGFVIFNDISKLIPGRSTSPPAQVEQAKPTQ
jgi:regulator of sigma E protease